MAPSLGAPVIRLHPETGARHLDVLTWGLLPYFSKSPQRARKPINARSDTVATSGMFKAAFVQRRCLVPAAAYYEWRDDPGGKVPFAVARRDGAPIAFAGIWEKWRSPEGEALQTFATTTTEANRQFSAIQDRMPVILERAGRRGRTCCVSGRSTGKSETSETTAPTCSSPSSRARRPRCCCEQAGPVCPFCAAFDLIRERTFMNWQGIGWQVDTPRHTEPPRCVPSLPWWLQSWPTFSSVLFVHQS